MIKTFRCKHTGKVFLREPVSKFSQAMCRRALRKLLTLDAAEQPDDLRAPQGNQLEKLAGDRQDRYSIRINYQWRICFLWDGGDVLEVEIVDCH